MSKVVEGIAGVVEMGAGIWLAGMTGGLGGVLTYKALGESLFAMGAASELGLVAGALSPSPRSGAGHNHQNVVYDPTYPRQFGFGRFVVAGSGNLVTSHNHYPWTESSGTWNGSLSSLGLGKTNPILELIIPLCDHECDGLDAVYCNDVPLTFGPEDATFQQNGPDNNRNGIIPGIGFPANEFTTKHGGVGLFVKFYSGADGQAPDAWLNQVVPDKWPASSVGTNVCYVRVTVIINENGNFSSIPTFRFVVRGAKLYDPRQDSTFPGGSGTQRLGQPSTYVWSDNTALIAYNILQGIYVGGNYFYGLPSGVSSFDDNNLVAALNACDEDVGINHVIANLYGPAYLNDAVLKVTSVNGLAVGTSITIAKSIQGLSQTVTVESITQESGYWQLGISPALSWDQDAGQTVEWDSSTSNPATEKRYYAGGCAAVTTPPGNVLQALAVSMGGTIAEVAGTWYLYPGVAQTPELSFTDDDIMADQPYQYQPKRPLTTLRNRVSGTFTDPTRKWASASFPARQSASDIAEDQGFQLETALKLDYVYSNTVAQRVAEITRRLGRDQEQHMVTLQPTAIQMTPGPWVQWSSAQWGYSNVSWLLKKCGYAPNMDTTLYLNQVDSTVYDWVPATDELGVQGGNLLSADPPTVTTDETTFTAQPITLSNTTTGAQAPALQISWPSMDSGINGVMIEYRVTGATLSSYSSAYQTGSTSIPLSMVIHGLLPNTSYDWRPIWLSNGNVVDWGNWQTLTTPDARIGSSQIGSGAVTIGPGGNVGGAVDGNGRAVTDFGSGLNLGQNADNIAPGSTWSPVRIASLTGGNVDLSLSGVQGRTLANIQDAVNRYAVTNGANLKGVATVDSANLAGINFASGVHLNQNADYIPAGSTWSPVNLASLTNGNVDLAASGVQGKTLANIADTTDRYAAAQPQAASAQQIASNPVFLKDLTNYNVYDNNGSGDVTLALVADGTAGNGSGYRMDVTTSANGATPGLGGFYYPLDYDGGSYAIDHYHQDETLLLRLRANIPSGYTLNWTSNSVGNGYSFTWLTPQAGTGAWQEYVVKLVCGVGGTLADTNYWFLTGPSTPVTWSVAKMSVESTTRPPMLGVSSIDSNQKALIDFSQAGHTNKTLDNIGDGLNYMRVGAHYVYTYNQPLIDFSTGAHYNKNLDNIGDGSTYGRIKTTFISTTNPNTPLIDFADAGHANKNIDNVADGSSYARIKLSYTSGNTPLIDFANGGHLNKNLANIFDGGGRYAAAEANADVTANHQSATTASLANQTLDALPDGSTYWRINQHYVLGGANQGEPLIDFSNASHYNKNLDNISDGTTYMRIHAHYVIADSSGDNQPLIDFSSGYHYNKNLDNIANGSTYARVNSSYVSSVSSPLYGNLLDNTVWKVGTSGSQSYFSSGGSSTNEIILNGGPFGASEPVWYCTGGYNGLNGGWNTNAGIPIDALKTYRYSVWVYWNGVSGNLYLGCNADGTVLNLDGTSNTNPYWIAGSTGVVPPSGWYLLVGYLHGSAYGTASSGKSGVYDPTTGNQIYVAPDFKSATAVSIQVQRTYLFYATDASTNAYFARPRIDVCDGTEPSIETLLGRATPGAQSGPGGNLFGDVDPNKRPYIDFSQSHYNKNQDNIAPGSTYGRIANSQVNGSGVPNLSVAGSGVQLGGTTNQLPVTVANYGSSWAAGLLVTYTSAAGSPATATISATSGTVNAGNIAINYNAASVGVTGSGGTSQKYYLFYNDPNYAGGSQTLVATTDPGQLTAGNGYVYVGTCTVYFPTSGTSSGNGGAAGLTCVVLETVLPGYEKADDVVPGDYLDLANPVTFERRKGLVSYAKTETVHCVRIETESGIELECSETAPIAIEGGEMVLAPYLAGKMIPVCDFGEWRIEQVVCVQAIGLREVRHITCENDLFLAGKHRGRYVLHHNAKP